MWPNVEGDWDLDVVWNMYSSGSWVGIKPLSLPLADLFWWSIGTFLKFSAQTPCKTENLHQNFCSEMCWHRPVSPKTKSNWSPFCPVDFFLFSKVYYQLWLLCNSKFQMYFLRDTWAVGSLCILMLNCCVWTEVASLWTSLWLSCLLAGEVFFVFDSNREKTGGWLCCLVSCPKQPKRIRRMGWRLFLGGG